MIQDTLKREFLTAVGYLLIGLVSLGAVFHWFPGAGQAKMMWLWLLIAAVLSIIRLVIIHTVNWFRRDEWQSVSRRRNW
jgi:hypothetical protein